MTSTDEFGTMFPAAFLAAKRAKNKRIKASNKALGLMERADKANIIGAFSCVLNTSYYLVVVFVKNKYDGGAAAASLLAREVLDEIIPSNYTRVDPDLEEVVQNVEGGVSTWCKERCGKFADQSAIAVVKLKGDHADPPPVDKPLAPLAKSAPVTKSSAPEEKTPAAPAAAPIAPAPAKSTPAAAPITATKSPVPAKKSISSDNSESHHKEGQPATPPVADVAFLSRPGATERLSNALAQVAKSTKSTAEPEQPADPGAAMAAGDSDEDPEDDLSDDEAPSPATPPAPVEKKKKRSPSPAPRSPAKKSDKAPAKKSDKAPAKKSDKAPAKKSGKAPAKKPAKRSRQAEPDDPEAESADAEEEQREEETPAPKPAKKGPKKKSRADKPVLFDVAAPDVVDQIVLRLAEENPAAGPLLKFVTTDNHPVIYPVPAAQLKAIGNLTCHPRDSEPIPHVMPPPLSSTISPFTSSTGKAIAGTPARSHSSRYSSLWPAADELETISARLKELAKELREHMSGSS